MPQHTANAGEFSCRPDLAVTDRCFVLKYMWHCSSGTTQLESCWALLPLTHVMLTDVDRMHGSHFPVQLSL